MYLSSKKHLWVMAAAPDRMTSRRVETERRRMHAQFLDSGLVLIASCAKGTDDTKRRRHGLTLDFMQHDGSPQRPSHLG